MTSRSTGFDTGTNGAAIATTDPGDPWPCNEVALVGTGTAVYSNTHAAHGALAAKLTAAAAGDRATIGWIVWNAATLTFSVYVYWAAYPSGAMDWITIRNGTTNAAKVQIWADGKIRVVNAGGSTIKTFAAAIGTGSWIRIELSVTKGTTTSNGQIKVAYYAGDSTTATDSYDSGAATDAGTTNLVTAHLGMLTGGTVTGEFWCDSMRGVDTAGPLGAWPAAVSVTVADESSGADSGYSVSTDPYMVIDDTSQTTDWITVIGPPLDPVPDLDAAQVGTAVVGGGVGWLYSLQEQSGALSAGDVSGQPRRPKLVAEQVGTGGGIEFGVTGTMPEGSAVAFTPASADNGMVLHSRTVRSYLGSGYAIVAQFAWTGDSGVQLLQVGDTGGSYITIYATPTAVLASLYPRGVRSTTALKGAVTNDGAPHFLVVTVVGNECRLFIDQDPKAAVASPQGMGWVKGLTVGGAYSGDPFQVAWAAYLPGAMSAERVADLAGLAIGAPEASDARVARVVRWIIGNADDLVSEPGLSLVAYQPTTDRDALEVIHEANQVEQGEFHAEGDGSFAQNSRGHRYNRPVDLVLDASTGIVVNSPLTIASGLSRMRNDITVGRPGGANYRARNQTSIDDYYEVSDQLTLYAATDLGLEGLAQWLVHRYGNPQPYVPLLTLDLFTADVAVANAVLQLRIGHRVQVINLPEGTPGGTLLDVFVEGFPDEQVSDTTWLVSLATSPALVSDVAVVGDPVRGVVGAPYSIAY